MGSREDYFMDSQLFFVRFYIALKANKEEIFDFMQFVANDCK